MIAVTQRWLDYFVDSTACRIWLAFTLTNGVSFNLYSENIVMGSLSIIDSISEPGEVKIGTTNSKELRVSLCNDDQMFSGIEFMGASVIVYFLAPPTDQFDTVRRGKFYIDDAYSHGNQIDLTGYDLLSQYDTPDLDGQTFTGTANDVLEDLFGEDNIDLFYLPNKTTPITATIGTDNLKSDATRRQLGQYIVEICGGYLKTNAWGLIQPKTLPMYDSTSDIDGGTFEYTSSTSAVVGIAVVGKAIVGIDGTDEENVDGGLFLAPFATNYVPIKNESWSWSEESSSTTVYRVDFVSNGANIRFTGFDHTGRVHTEEITDSFTIPVGQYWFDTNNHSSYFDLVLENLTQNLVYSEGDRFFNESDTDEYIVSIKTKANFICTNAFVFTPILTDKPYLGETIFQLVWQSTTPYDGGYFNFWNVTSTKQHTPLSKVLTYPPTSEKKTITGVRVMGNDISTVEVGSMSGEVIEINDNPLITTQAFAQTVAEQVLSVVGGVSYYEFSADWFADPRYEAGDIVSFQNDKGNTVVTMCTEFNYNHGNSSNISCVK